MLSLIQSCGRLKSKGYEKDLSIHNGKLLDMKKVETPVENCEITEVYRVDEDSGGAGQSVAYGISEITGIPIGVLITSYGANTEDGSEEVLSRLKQNLSE